ncbi:hypothetical protein QBC39DRAFT_354387 [Podospora conica]|nr:hypothetical protein QBC39DRAFT_354387 [Schizothecium conicum]
MPPCKHASWQTGTHWHPLKKNTTFPNTDRCSQSPFQPKERHDTEPPKLTIGTLTTDETASCSLGLGRLLERPPLGNASWLAELVNKPPRDRRLYSPNQNPKLNLSVLASAYVIGIVRLPFQLQARQPKYQSTRPDQGKNQQDIHTHRFSANFKAPLASSSTPSIASSTSNSSLPVTTSTSPSVTSKNSAPLGTLSYWPICVAAYTITPASVNRCTPVLVVYTGPGGLVRPGPSSAALNSSTTIITRRILATRAGRIAMASTHE